jgi:hypothetical protein
MAVAQPTNMNDTSLNDRWFRADPVAHSDRQACPACRRQIHIRFARCPLCAARIREPPIQIVFSNTFTAEVQAAAIQGSGATALSGGPAARPDGNARPTWSVEETPRSDSVDLLRVFEVVLSILSLPFYLCSLLGLVVGVKRWGRLNGIDWVFGALLGALISAPLLKGALENARSPTLALIAFAFAAWILRGVLCWFDRARQV